MTNDNKKINDLVVENDEDTSELEILSATAVFGADLDYEAESDAATHSFGSSNSAAGADPSVTALQSDLKEREGRIDSLQYDIEDLRARWNGLENELKAREALTENLRNELEQANRKLAQSITLLKKRDSKIATLETTLGQKMSSLAEAESTLEHARQEAETRQAEIAAFHERELAAATKLDSLLAELAEERSGRRVAVDAKQAQDILLRELEEQHAETTALVASLQQYIDGRKDQWQQQEAALGVQKRSLGEQRTEIARLAREARVAAERLRKEQSSKARLLAARANLQKDLEQVRAEALELQAALSGSEDSQRVQQEQIAALCRQLEDAGPALEQEKAERQSLQVQLDDQQRLSRSLQAELTALQKVSAERETLLIEQQESIAGLSREVGTLSSRLAGEETGRKSLEGQLQKLQEEAAGLRSEKEILLEQASAKDQLILEQKDALGELRREHTSLTETVAAERQSFETQLQTLEKDAARLRSAHDILLAETAEKDQLIQEQRHEIGELNRARAALIESLEAEQSAHLTLARQHEALEDEATQLRTELQPLKATAAKAEALEAAHAELAGLVASHEDTLRALKGQLSKTEGYADVLRAKLQQQMALADSLSAESRQAEESLAAALARADDLGGRLEAELAVTAELKKHNDEAEERLEAAVTEIRSELDAVQQTVAEHQAVSEQLKSELVESAALRHALEKRLAESDEARQREAHDFASQLSQSKQKISDYEHKLSNKDAAINALLSELARKPELPARLPPRLSKESAADEAVQRIPERKRHSGEDKSYPEKDRVTRLLIGSIEGQELRFPLFKDKLTIGRTVHNDIQLKAQYISRRHAVVVTEEEHSRIVDWGSKNGIYVNGKRVSEQVLKNGDRLTVGTAEFKFEERPKR